MDNKGQAYYQDLLKQYFAGTISNDDRFELEKCALDDPFLFEALQGGNETSIDNTKVVQQLKTDITQASAKKETKRIPIFNYGIAASLILLLGLGMWLLNPSSSSQDNLALESAPQNIENEMDQISLNQDLAIRESATTTKTAASQNNQYDSPKADISQKENEKLLAASDNDDVAAAPEPVPEITVVTPTEQKKIIIPPPVAKVKSKPSVQKPETKEELQGIEKVLENNKAGAQKNKQRASFQVGDENAEAKSESIISTIRQDLDYAREEYIESIDKDVLVTPIGGMIGFKNSLKETSQQFGDTVKSSDDEIVVKFKIDTSGQPMDFDIISGQDQDCINRIITMLKYGAKWITAPQNKAVSVRLELPCY